MLKIPVQIPFHPKKFRLFYGWIILFAGIIGVLASIPGQTMGVSVFTDHLINDLNVSRVQLSLAYLIGTGVSGLIITYAGVLYDKFGARIIAMSSGFMLGTMLVFLARVDKIAGFFHRLFNSIDAETIMMIVLVVGFFGIRFFGQGVLTMASRNMVMKWFDKRRGFANALLGVFTSLGFSISPKILQLSIEQVSWRNTWLILAVIVGLGFVIFVFIFFRDNPSDAGLKPDGKNVVLKKQKFKSTPDRDFTLKEAIHTYSFWLFNLNMTFFALFATALTFHIESIFANAGFDITVAVSIFLPASVAAVCINFIGSWLSDSMRLKYFLIFSYFSMLLSILGFVNLEASWGIPVLIAGFGIMQGMFGILIAITWPRFFGLKHLGSISGFAMSCMVIGSALGPFIFSLSNKHYYSYNHIAIILGLIAFVLFLMSFRANNVNDRGV